MSKTNPNTGHRVARTEIGDDVGRLEKALMEHWRDENTAQQGWNYGNGILQDLFITGGQLQPMLVEKITKRDRMIVATVIQWLGTNIGRCFLETAFRKAGWTLKMEPIRKPKTGA